MIVQDDTTDNVLKYRAKIKANIAATNPSTVLDDQRELADYASGHATLPTNNPELMATILGYAIIGYTDIMQEVIKERRSKSI